MTGETDDRYAREKAFHDDRYGDESRLRAKKFYAASPAASFYRSRLETVPAGSRVLEYGCGQGSSAYDLQARGVETTGIDISSTAIEQARAEADARGLRSLEFREMNAEQLDFPDGSFDLVCGSGILHHLDLETAYGEVARVLAPGGRGLFLEPLGHNPVINLYRRVTPSMRTVDEHPLRREDLALAGRFFGRVEPHWFQLTTIAATPLRRFSFFPRAVHRLARTDDWLFDRFPRLRLQAWTVVLELAAPHLPASAADHSSAGKG